MLGDESDSDSLLEEYESFDGEFFLFELFRTGDPFFCFVYLLLLGEGLLICLPYSILMLGLTLAMGFGLLPTPEF